MANNENHAHLTTDNPHHLRRYIVRAAKAYLCALCWFGLCAVLLMYGPPAVSVSPNADGIVAVGFGVMLSTGSATVLTIVLAFGVLAVIEQIRSGREQDETEATDGMEDETHA